MDTAVEALHFGASDFVTKPFRGETLAIAIRRAEEKIDIRRRLKEYTLDLEDKIEKATRELRRRSNFLTKVIRSSNDGVVATDEELRIVVFNPGRSGSSAFCRKMSSTADLLRTFFPKSWWSPFNRP